MIYSNSSVIQPHSRSVLGRSITNESWMKMSLLSISCCICQCLLRVLWDDSIGLLMSSRTVLLMHTLLVMMSARARLSTRPRDDDDKSQNEIKRIAIHYSCVVAAAAAYGTLFYFKGWKTQLGENCLDFIQSI